MKKGFPKPAGKISLVTAIIIAIIIGSLKFSNPPRNIISWDVFGFYLYLPSTFIYHDPGLDNIEVYENIIEKYGSSETFYQVFMGPKDHWVIRSFIGISYFYAPFFIAGHIYALNSTYEADGYSLPYQRAIWIGGFLYTLLGLFLLRKVLLKFIGDKETTLTLVLLYLGSNLFFFATYGNDSPHVYLFTLYPLIFLLTIKWHEVFKKKYAFLLGLLLGILVVSRPSEIFAIFIPLVWGVYDKATLQKKIRVLLQYKSHLALLALGGFLAILPQLIYWKYVTGSFIYFTYNNPGKGFDLLTPHFYRALFGFRKGMFIYAPVMIFAFMGLIPLYRNRKEIFYPVLAFLTLTIYLISSHSALISFGWRAFIQSYAVMAIPLGFFVQWLFGRKIILKIILSATFLFLIFLNHFQTWQLRYGIIDGSRMTMSYYWRVFLRTEASEEDRKLLLIKRPATTKEEFQNEEEYDKRLLAHLDFNDPATGPAGNYDTAYFHSAGFALRMDSTLRFSPGIKVSFRDLTDRDHAWIRAGVWVHPAQNTADNEALLIIAFSHKGKLYKYRYLSTGDPSLELRPDDWNWISLDYLTPEVRSASDMLEVYIWYRGNEQIYIDDIRVEVFEQADNP